MAQVKDYVAKVIAIINEIGKQNPAASKEERISPSKEERGTLGILSYYEQIWSLQTFCTILGDHAGNTAELSPATMKPILEEFVRRGKLIAKTNGILNHHRFTPANCAYRDAAAALIEFGVDPSKKHHYDVIYPGLHSDDYVTSKGAGLGLLCQPTGFLAMMRRRLRCSLRLINIVKKCWVIVQREPVLSNVRRRMFACRRMCCKSAVRSI